MSAIAGSIQLVLSFAGLLMSEMTWLYVFNELLLWTIFSAVFVVKECRNQV
ncbi:MAG: hypothetical protein Q9M17_01025 [Mariprofundus sp.]|nr:hypothetical protein [Mariprofundus sp.]